MSCGSAFTIKVAAIPTSHPVPTQNYPNGMDQRPEPITGSATETAAIYEPVPTRATWDYIAPEPEQSEPDQVCEPAEPSIANGVLVNFEGSQVSPAHPPSIENEFLAETLLDSMCGEEYFCPSTVA